jgi:hypothetical protein
MKQKERLCSNFLHNYKWCSDIGNYPPQEELAKFGYMSERKIQKFKSPANFWQPAETYCLNMAISEIFSSETWQLWLFFFFMQILCMSRIGFFWSPQFEASPKNTLTHCSRLL